MNRHRGRGFGTIATVAAGVSLLVLVAVFVWWISDGSETESSCDTCGAAEAGDLAGVRSALAARIDPGERSAEATRALDPALH
ncbi:MAG: hypothetical protein KJ062_21390, partial [Thermoanaerobaculia bacterium]|nr:hypothetical protein [Thermoanaerobaculia bacterium]